MSSFSSLRKVGFHADHDQQDNNQSKNVTRQKQALENSETSGRGNGDEVERDEVANPLGVPSWKRGLDLACIILTLPIWMPVMLLISACIKLVSRGPVLFCQQRIGIGGRPFMLLKFRSMRVNIETQCHEAYLEQLIKSDCPMIKMDKTGDSRFIPGGRLFRATALDELPQLFNVIRGEMSLVGPRPCTTHEFERYQPWQRIGRTRMLPGLTGYWQVHGKNNTTFSEMIAMDIRYGERMSLWADLVIMARTIPVILGQVLEAWMKKRSGSQVSRPEQTSAAKAV